MSEILDPIPLDQVAKNRLAREEKYRERQKATLAKKFETGISIMTAPEDNNGKRRILKDKFIEVLTYDIDGILNDDRYTADEADRIRKSLSRSSAAPGLAVTMTCPGAEKCPFDERCPFAREKKEPTGKPCPQEHILFTEILMRYMESLEVDPTNMMELAYLNELAETEILIMRANKALSRLENVELVQETTQLIQGQRVDVLQVSPHIEARDRLVKRRERIIKLMVGDRQERYKMQAALKKKDTSDESVDQSKKANRILNAQLTEQMDKAESDLTKESEDSVIRPEEIMFEDEE